MKRPGRKPKGALSRAELDRLVDSRAGCRQLRYTHKTGALVGLYQAAESGLEMDPETPWATVCEDHSNLVCHETRLQAERCLGYPHEWCEDCQTIFYDANKQGLP